jgi:hypothetical protein
MVNFSAHDVPIRGSVALSSNPLQGCDVAPETAVWTLDGD